METISKKHSICIEDNKKAILTGLTAVVSIFDKEIEVSSQDNRIIIKGVGLTANKLNVEEGTLIIEGDFISAVSYMQNNRSKINFKGMFK